MRIMNDENGEELFGVLIMLTPSEAKQLVDLLRTISPESGEHIHVTDLNHSRELTIAIYTPENLHYYNEDVRRLIEKP